MAKRLLAYGFVAVVFSPALMAAAALTPTEIISAAKPNEWRALDPARTLVMSLETGNVVIELAPRFAPNHVANVRQLVSQGYFDGLTVNRVQDNFVAQWGDPSAKREIGQASKTLAPEFTTGLLKAFQALPDADHFAAEVGFVDGFAAARDLNAKQTWLTHCYATVGVGRDNAADSGGGTELYAVIGHAPRQLDRNITVLGRVVLGMELLSSLPRSLEPGGFFSDPQQGAKILRIRAGTEALQLEALRTDSLSFQALIEARRNRRDEWYLRPAGYVDICNVPLPVREKEASVGRVMGVERVTK